MLSKLKNLTNNDIVVNDLGVTILGNSYYDVSTKKYSKSEDLILHISNGLLVFVKSESPEVLYTLLESLQYVYSGIINIPKMSNTGENITLKNEYGHLPGNNIVNWTFNKYLSDGDSYSEKMYIPLEKSVTINSFSTGSFNVPTSALLELFEWNVDFNDFIRINRDIRMDEFYMSKINTILISNTDVLTVNNINDFDIDLVYQIETIDNIPLYRKIINTNSITNEITLNIPVPNFNNIPVDAKLTLIDRPLSENNSQLSNNIITWSSPIRINGNNSSYLKVTIMNEDDSEPGNINSSINGWIGNI